MLQYFQCEQNLVTNSIWIYTIATLRINQWELFEEFTSDDDSGQKYAAYIQNYLLQICLFADFARWKTN